MNDEIAMAGRIGDVDRVDVLEFINANIAMARASLNRAKSDMDNALRFYQIYLRLIGNEELIECLIRDRGAIKFYSEGTSPEDTMEFLKYKLSFAEAKKRGIESGFAI